MGQDITIYPVRLAAIKESILSSDKRQAKDLKEKNLEKSARYYAAYDPKRKGVQKILKRDSNDCKFIVKNRLSSVVKSDRMFFYNFRQDLSSIKRGGGTLEIISPNREPVQVHRCSEDKNIYHKTKFGMLGELSKLWNSFRKP